MQTSGGILTLKQLSRKDQSTWLSSYQTLLWWKGGPDHTLINQRICKVYAPVQQWSWGSLNVFSVRFRGWWSVKLKWILCLRKAIIDRVALCLKTTFSFPPDFRQGNWHQVKQQQNFVFIFFLSFFDPTMWTAGLNPRRSHSILFLVYGFSHWTCLLRFRICSNWFRSLSFMASTTQVRAHNSDSWALIQAKDGVLDSPLRLLLVIYQSVLYSGDQDRLYNNTCMTLNRL